MSFLGPCLLVYVAAAVAADDDDDDDNDDDSALVRMRQVIVLFRNWEQSLRFSDILKQGVKLLVYTLLACHLGACWLHAIACFNG